jgi:hypothetical protein
MCAAGYQLDEVVAVGGVGAKKVVEMRVARITNDEEARRSASDAGCFTAPQRKPRRIGVR